MPLHLYGFLTFLLGCPTTLFKPLQLCGWLLERKGLIAAEYRAGSGGPSRKYYRLTPDGVQYLNEFTEAWQNASDTVNRILHDKEG